MLVKYLVVINKYIYNCIVMIYDLADNVNIIVLKALLNLQRKTKFNLLKPKDLHKRKQGKLAKRGKYYMNAIGL